MTQEIILKKTLFTTLPSRIVVFLFLFILMIIEFYRSDPYNYHHHSHNYFYHSLLPEEAFLGLIFCEIVLFLEIIYKILFRKSLLLLSDDGITFTNGIAITNHILVPWKNIANATLQDEGLYLTFIYKEMNGEDGYVNYIAKTQKSYIDINEEILQSILKSRE